MIRRTRNPQGSGAIAPTWRRYREQAFRLPGEPTIPRALYPLRRNSGGCLYGWFCSHQAFHKPASSPNVWLVMVSRAKLTW